MWKVPFFTAHWLKMYICSHPQVLLHLRSCLSSSSCYIWSQTGSTSLARVFSAGSYIVWFSVKRSGWFSGQSSWSPIGWFPEEFSESLSVCSDLIARACSSVVVRWYMIVTGNDTVGIADTQRHHQKKFHMKDLDHLRYFLGLKIAQAEREFLFHSRNIHIILLTLLHLYTQR